MSDERYSVHESHRIETTEVRGGLSGDLHPRPASPAGLPAVPLMHFDFDFKTLQGYLQHLKEVVDGHAQDLMQVQQEVIKRVTTNEMDSVMTALSVQCTQGVNLPAGIDPPPRQDWGQLSGGSKARFEAFGKKVKHLTEFEVNTKNEIADMKDQIKNMYTKEQVKKKIKKACSKTKKKCSEKTKELKHHVDTVDTQLDNKITSLEKRFQELEVNTVWKLKDCQDLLKTRVNEQFVWDAIKTIEENSKKQTTLICQREMANLEKQLKHLQTELKRVEGHYGDKIRKQKEFIDELDGKVEAKTNQPDHDQLRKDLEAFMSEIRGANFLALIVALENKFSALVLKLEGADDESGKNAL